MKLRCVKCEKLVDLELSDCGPHIKASCLECGAYIKFVSAKELEGGNKMSEFETVYKKPNDQYGECLIFSKFQDNYQILAGGLSKKADGTTWFKQVFAKKKDGTAAATAIPMGITIGNLVEAHGFADWLKKNLPPLPNKQKPVDKPAGPVNDDIPF